MEYYFISPHLDDAILSCGALIYELAKKTKLSIVTIFTECKYKTNNKAADKLLKSSGYDNFKKLFEARKLEDKMVCNFLNIRKIHLGFVDASWRTSYINEREIFAGIVKEDGFELKLQESIKLKLKKIVYSKNSVIFSPIGVGGHVDHMITRKVCEEMFSDLIYWEDVPYNLRLNNWPISLKIHHFKRFNFKHNLFVKERLIRYYATQIQGIFNTKPMVLKREAYFYKIS